MGTSGIMSCVKPSEWKLQIVEYLSWLKITSAIKDSLKLCHATIYVHSSRIVSVFGVMLVSHHIIKVIETSPICTPNTSNWVTPNLITKLKRETSQSLILTDSKHMRGMNVVSQNMQTIFINTYITKITVTFHLGANQTSMMLTEFIDAYVMTLASWPLIPLKLTTLHYPHI